MKTLHVYHNKYIKSVYHNFKKDDVITNEIGINLIRIYLKMNSTLELKDFTFITIGKIDNMRFDYVIGNPPYEYPKSLNTSSNKKLYIDITSKVIHLLKKNGELFFITPQSILDNGKQNSVFNYLSKNITLVDYTADTAFNIGQKVCSWKYKNNNSSNSKIIVIDECTREVNNIYECSTDKNKLYSSIRNKVDYRLSKKNKMKIICSNKRCGIETKDLTEKGAYKVIKHNSNDKIGYTNIITKYPYNHVLLPYLGKFEKIQVTPDLYTGQFYTNKNYETDIVLENMNLYIHSHLISYLLCKTKENKSTQVFDFYTKLPEIDFSKKWTNEELYKEFNLTNDEINEVEKWYEKWKK